MTNEELKIIVSAKDQASSVLANINKSIIGIGAAFLSLGTVKTIITDIIREGMEAEKVWHNLSAALKLHGFEVSKSKKLIEEFTASMQMNTTVNDELAAKAIQRLIDANMGLEQAFRTVKVAADMAAAKDVDLITATDFLAKASMGYTRQLAIFGIKIDETIPKAQQFESILKQLEQRFGGRAASELETYAGKLERLKNIISDFKEDLFEGFASAISTIKDKFFDLIMAPLRLFPEVEKQLAMMGLATVNTAKDFSGAAKEIDKMNASLKAAGDTAKYTEEELEKSRKMGAETLRRLHNMYIESLWAEAAATEAVAAESEKRAIRGAKTINMILESVHDLAWKRAEKAKQQADETARQAAAQVAMIEGMFSNAVDATVREFLTGRMQLADIWKGMAQDFIVMFIQEILKETIAAAAKLVKSLLFFDVPENDRALIRVGRDYAKYFRQGADIGFKGFAASIPTPAPAYPGMGYSGQVYNYNINISSKDLNLRTVRKEIIPAIDRLIISGRSSLAKKNNMITGQSDALIY